VRARVGLANQLQERARVHGEASEAHLCRERAKRQILVKPQFVERVDRFQHDRLPLRPLLRWARDDAHRLEPVGVHVRLSFRSLLRPPCAGHANSRSE